MVRIAETLRIKCNKEKVFANTRTGIYYLLEAEILMLEYIVNCSSYCYDTILYFSLLYLRVASQYANLTQSIAGRQARSSTVVLLMLGGRGRSGWRVDATNPFTLSQR